jgi:hypothetical protein
MNCSLISRNLAYKLEMLGRAVVEGHSGRHRIIESQRPTQTTALRTRCVLLIFALGRHRRPFRVN